MSLHTDCPACQTGNNRVECVNSFARKGVLKVHWECWSNCNLSCSFCYRSRGVPLDTQQAFTLIGAIKTAGAKSIVLAGGDPSLRSDMADIVAFASDAELHVEVQTNSQFQPKAFLATLLKVKLVGLSLDGPTAEIHDGMRCKSGNFAQVIKLLDYLEANAIPVIVRTIVARPNYQNIATICNLLEGRQNIVRWSLLEFTAVGDGFRNREEFLLPIDDFREVVQRTIEVFRGPAKIDPYFGNKKLGTYVLITPAGEVYGTTKDVRDGFYPMIGSILREHLNDIADRIPFSAENHTQRYKQIIS
jgi:MoaA/NifB/PqqE/SkfB family radical SAM enzyme